MAFNMQNYDATGSGSKSGAPKLAYYSTSDALATVMASGYFDNVATVLSTGDKILVKSSHATDGGVVIISVTNTSNVITTTGNIGKVYLTGEIADISTAASSWVISPIAGKITKITTVIDAAITVADATLSFEIGGTAVTGGGITIATSGSAAGDVDTATPTAANTLAAGGALELITDGGSTTASKAIVLIEITPTT